MRLLASTILAAAILTLTPGIGQAQLTAFGEDFEGLNPTSTTALSDSGWVVFGNVFDTSGNFLYGYGTFPAPNSSAPGVQQAWSRIAVGEGGPSQGDQQLAAFSDYENLDHAAGRLIESNLFVEQIVGPGDVGTKWYFEFDAKFGDIKPDSSEAIAFIKTISPAPNFFLTNFKQVRISGLRGDGTEPYTPNPNWQRYGIELEITSGLVGSFLQFGFLTKSTLYAPSVVFYDNIEFNQTQAVLDAPERPVNVAGVQLQVLGNPVIGSAPQQLSFTTVEAGHVSVRVFDVEGKIVSTLVDRELEAGVHEATWEGRGTTGRLMPPGVYFAEVVAGNERIVSKLIRAR